MGRGLGGDTEWGNNLEEKFTKTTTTKNHQMESQEDARVSIQDFQLSSKVVH